MRIDNGAYQCLQVKARLREISSQPGQQFRMCGRVRFPHVVDRLDQAPAHQLAPDAVYSGAGKPGILRRRNPLRQNFATVLQPPDDRLRPIQQSWPENLPALRVAILSIKVHVEDGLRRLWPAALPLHLGKESRHTKKVIALPVLEGVVMATSALQTESHERLGCRRYVILGIQHIAVAAIKEIHLS